MALNDNAVITASVGYLFIAPVGTNAPTPAELEALDLETFDTLTAWEQIGHTSRDDMPEFGYDGGDTEVKGTWQKKRLREIATGDPVEDSVTIKLEQFDPLALELYFGKNISSTPGVFAVDGEFTPIEKALLVIIVDRDVRIGFHAHKASIKRDDSIELPVDGFANLPIKATFLNMKGKPLFSWISDALLSGEREYTLNLGGATSGTFMVTVDSEDDTSAIAFNAAAGAIQTAVRAAGASDAVVTASGANFTIKTTHVLTLKPGALVGATSPSLAAA